MPKKSQFPSCPPPRTADKLAETRLIHVSSCEGLLKDEAVSEQSVGGRDRLDERVDRDVVDEATLTLSEFRRSIKVDSER